jgi:DNA-binding GntR family transcriptional regulator
MLRYRIKAMCNPEGISKTIKGHKKILDALKRRHESALCEAIEEHLEMAKRDIRYFAFNWERKNLNYREEK